MPLLVLLRIIVLLRTINTSMIISYMSMLPLCVPSIRQVLPPPTDGAACLCPGRQAVPRSAGKPGTATNGINLSVRVGYLHSISSPGAIMAFSSALGLAIKL